MATEKSEAFRRTAPPLPYSIERVADDVPALLPTQILVRIRAVSLNYRDIAILNGNYPVTVLPRGIPASDCAAEVVAIGPGVSKFDIGNHVSPIFKPNHLNEQDKREKEDVGLGGEVEGVLRRFAVFDEEVLVKVPANLSWEEAATIPCAGTTAWNALGMPGSLGKIKTALLQGTGGVSMFGLLICLHAGIRPIITSSSDVKLAEVGKLALPGTSIDTVNYRTYPDWEQEVLRLTNGRGVDIVFENVGPTTVGRSFSCLAKCGTVSLIGFLGGFDAKAKMGDMFLPLMLKAARAQGIRVGTKPDHENLNKFIEEEKISLTPLVHRVFSFDESPAAFEYLATGKHSGKVIITI